MSKGLTLHSRGRSAKAALLLRPFLLDIVAVHPRFHGRGIGRRLLEFAESEARRAGHSDIYLYTHEKMTENRALYSKIGYVEYDRRIEMGYSRVYMRKRLSWVAV